MNITLIIPPNPSAMVLMHSFLLWICFIQIPYYVIRTDNMANLILFAQRMYVRIVDMQSLHIGEAQDITAIQLNTLRAK